MPRRASKTGVFDEPSCWGSGELPLLPKSLARVLHGIPVVGYRDKNNRRVALQLNQFASESWSNGVKTYKWKNDDLSALDTVLQLFTDFVVNNLDLCDVPVLGVPLDRFENASCLPFETRTWDVLTDIGATSDLEVMVLVTGTFRELFDRLGDIRAALDVAVTGAAWVVPNEHGSYGFLVPESPTTLQHAQQLVRTRGVRTVGYSPDSPSYRPKYLEALGGRLGSGMHKRWSLEHAASLAGVTRERIRQLSVSVMKTPALRRWTTSPALEELAQQLMEGSTAEIISTSSGETIERLDAVALLGSYGYPDEDLRGPWTIDDELLLHGYKMSDIRRFVFQQSERLGLMTLTELELHVSDSYPELLGELFTEFVDALVVAKDLPHGYLYFDGARGNWIRNWINHILSVFGPTSFEEVYAACARFCKIRLSQIVFPPRAVIRAVIERDEAFWIENDVVGAAEPNDFKLVGVEKWMFDTISNSPGCVIHNNELWSRGRDNNVKSGTLTVYRGYSLYFKQIGHGCISLTGLNPSPAFVQLANARAAAIRIPTRFNSEKISGSRVILEVQVGTGLVDTGILSSRKEHRQMLGGTTFSLYAGRDRHGNANWSGNVMTGFSQIFQALRVEPGDVVEFTFDVTAKKATLRLIEDQD